VNHTIKSLRELCEKAAKGPWEFYYATGESPGIVRYSETKDGFHQLEECVMPVYPKKDKDINNIQFIVASRSALPILLDEIKELRSMLRKVREGVALMAEGEGDNPQTYMDISLYWMKKCDKALTKSLERVP
jgi:hypothetical protein